MTTPDQEWMARLLLTQLATARGRPIGIGASMNSATPLEVIDDGKTVTIRARALTLGEAVGAAVARVQAKSQEAQSPSLGEAAAQFERKLRLKEYRARKEAQDQKREERQRWNLWVSTGIGQRPQRPEKVKRNDMKTFNTPARRAATKPIDFELDGDRYHFTPPKTTGIYLAGVEGSQTDQLKAQLDWIEAGLPEEEAAHLRARLLDVTDDLEVLHVLEVIAWLLEGRRPTAIESSDG